MATSVVKRPRSSQSAHYLRQTKIPTLMFATSAEADKHVSLVVESLIRENNSAGMPTVLVAVESAEDTCPFQSVDDHVASYRHCQKSCLVLFRQSFRSNHPQSEHIS